MATNHSTLAGADLHEPKGAYPTPLELADETEAYSMIDADGDVLVIDATNKRLSLGEAANLYEFEQGPRRTSIAIVQTTDATVTTLWSRAIGEADAAHVRATVTALSSANGAGYERVATVRRLTGGNVALVGSVSTPHTAEDDAAWDCTLDVDTGTQTVRLRVTGAAATTIAWTASIEVLLA